MKISARAQRVTDIDIPRVRMVPGQGAAMRPSFPHAVAEVDQSKRSSGFRQAEATLPAWELSKLECSGEDSPAGSRIFLPIARDASQNFYASKP